VRVSGETCPQYLLLTEEAYEGVEGPQFSVMPPLRTGADQALLWEGLLDGTLDLVATDHCPFTREQKTWNGSFLDLPYGLPGVETLLPLLYSEGVRKGRLPLTALPRLLSEGPARVNGLYPRKGTLSIGADAGKCVEQSRRRSRADGSSMPTGPSTEKRVGGGSSPMRGKEILV
jgi:dihydropyrimidinase